MSAAAGWRGARARAAGLVPGLSPAAAPPRPPLCFVSAGPRRCDSHFRSWRLEGAGWGGAGEAVRGAEGRGAGSGMAGAALRDAAASPGAVRAPRVVPALPGLSGRCQTCLSPDSAVPALQIQLPFGNCRTGATILMYRMAFRSFPEDVSESSCTLPTP